MYSVFHPSERSNKKTLIEEMNATLNQKLDALFAENYEAMRQELLEDGWSESDVDARLQEVKQETQRDMVLMAQNCLRKHLNSLTRRSDAASQETVCKK